MIDFSKWTSNTYNQKCFIEYYDSYIQQFPISYRATIEKVLSCLDYYDEEKMDDICQKYTILFNNEKYNDYCHLTTTIDTEVHKSDSFYVNLKAADRELKLEKTYKNEELKKHKNFIICDDYSGSGDTIMKTVDYIYKYRTEENIHKNPIVKFFESIYQKKQFKKLKFVFYPAIGCSFSKDNIAKAMNAEYKSNTYEVKTVIDRENGYSSIKSKFIDDEIKIINKVNDYCGVKGKYRNGYNESFDLIAMHYGTPNNTVGFLWYTNGRKALPFFNRAPMHLWYTQKNKFCKYSDYLYVVNYVNNDRNFRDLKKPEKVVLYLILLGYGKNTISLFQESLNLDGIINKLIDKKYIDSNLKIVKKIPDEIKRDICKCRLGLNPSAESIVEMNLMALKNE